MKLFKQLSTMLLLFLVVTASAQSALVIELRDGSNATFLLAENPRVTFSGEQLSIVSSSATMEFNRSDVKNWHFADTPSSVENIAAEAKVKLEGGALLISGITDDTAIALYSVDGVAVKHSAVIGGTCTIPLDDIPAGIYIVKFNNMIFKFRKK